MYRSYEINHDYDDDDTDDDCDIKIIKWKSTELWSPTLGLTKDLGLRQTKRY